MTDENNSEEKTGTSTELTGGAGFTFEDTVVAHYLAALLQSEGAGGINGTVKRVAVQQRSVGFPLDDVVVNTDDESGERQLSLQVKRSLTISAASGNKEFLQIINDCRATRADSQFRVNRDAYGFVAQEVSAQSLRDFRRIIEYSKASTSALEFVQRFEGEGASSKKQRKMRENLRKVVAESSEAEWDFYKHFVVPNFAGLEEGGALAATIKTHLNSILSVDSKSSGHVLFNVLCRNARVGAGAGAIWTRPVLLNQLSGDFRFRGVPTFADDLETIDRLTASALAEISDQVATVHIDRPTSVDKALSLLNDHRLVNITGLPGCGKSAILRNTAERVQSGTVVFLKSDLLVGTGWQEFSVAKGLTHRSPTDLLAEIGSTGNNILYIDGIDRIPPPQRAIIKELLHAIINEPSLHSWRVLVTSRNQGMEPFRVWLPTDLYNDNGIGDLSVDVFDDTEAELLADKIPNLRPLLFGTQAIRGIARRPFYAAVLASSNAFGVQQTDSQSEVDLISYWWGGGGYNAGAESLLLRQRALLDLASVGGRSLGKAVNAMLLKPETTACLVELIDDGVVRTSDEHATYSFTHDIYFEWAYYRLLCALGADWPNALIDAGQPPLLGRVVGLYAQRAIETDLDWKRGIKKLSNADMRTQWLRCWITGPVLSPRFVDHQDKFTEILSANDWEMGRKFLLWFQATNTIPNPRVLESGQLSLEATIRVQLADVTGWPADLPAWLRVLKWLLLLVSILPTNMRLVILELFKVWQNALSATPNLLSEKIINVCAVWLEELDDVEYPKQSSFESGLRQLILQSMRAYPSAGLAVIDRTINRKYLRASTYESIMGLSPIISKVAPERLANLARAELLESLPHEELSVVREEQNRYSEYLKKIQAKPQEERTEDEQRSLNFRSLSSHDRIKDYKLSNLAVPQYHRTYFPTSPSQEPFSSLFSSHPDIALALVKDMGNHATTAWRQIHEIKKQQFGTPLPLALEFPWGKQRFWGNSDHYIWGTNNDGAGAPLSCAFMALAHWAHKELDSGTDNDEIIRKIIEGHQSVAVLRLACSLALEGPYANATILPLATCARVWHMDISRRMQEKTSEIDLLGIASLTQPKGEKGIALDYLKSRASRGHDISNLAPCFALSADTEIREKFQRGLERFPDELPYEYEEERNSPELEAYLRERAVQWAGMGHERNYQQAATHDAKRISITYESPTPPSESAQQRSEQASISLRDYAVFNWASKSLQDGGYDASDTPESCIELAQTRDNPELFEHLTPAGGGMAQSAVSAVAACVLLFGSTSTSDLTWANDVMRRVKSMEESDDFGVSNMPWHPSFHLIVVLKVEISKPEKHFGASSDLIQLCIHPNKGVSEAALSVLMNCEDLVLAWNSTVLASDLCHRYQAIYIQGEEMNNDAQEEAKLSAVSRAIERLSTKEKATPSTLPNPSESQRSGSLSPFDLDNAEDEQKSLVVFDHDHCSRLVQNLQVGAFSSSAEYQDLLFSYVKDLVTWTELRFNPESSNDHNVRPFKNERVLLNEWPKRLGELLAKISPYVDLTTMNTELLGPFLKPNDASGLQVISEFVKWVVVIHIIDAKVVNPHVLSSLDKCLDQLLAGDSLRRGSHRAGELEGYSEKPMAKSLLFVPFDEEARGAERFANGDWTSLPTVLPLINKFVGVAGWSPDVITIYLDMVERAWRSYPIDSFTVLITKVLSELRSDEDGWVGKAISARIAGVIQMLADSNYPLAEERSTALLKPIDMLIDLGDRRAAALEESETFRSAQVK